MAKKKNLNNAFTVYRQDIEVLRMLPKERVADVLFMIADIAFGDIGTKVDTSELDKTSEIVFLAMESHVRHDVEKYAKKVMRSEKRIEKRRVSCRNNVQILEDVLRDLYQDGTYISDDLADVMFEWMQYKDSRNPKSGNRYGSEEPVRKLVEMFSESEESFGIDRVQQIVNNSISNNYAGIIWQNI